MYCWKNSLS